LPPENPTAETADRRTEILVLRTEVAEGKASTPDFLPQTGLSCREQQFPAANGLSHWQKPSSLAPNVLLAGMMRRMGFPSPTKWMPEIPKRFAERGVCGIWWPNPFTFLCVVCIKSIL